MTGGRGRGRPPVGPRITIRLPEPLLERIDAYADEGGITRAEAIRELLEEITP